MSMFMEVNKILSKMQVVAAGHGIKTPHIDKLTTYKFTNMNSSENITESNVVENTEENKASVQEAIDACPVQAISFDD